MNELEVLYKALKDYVKATSDRRDLSSLRAAISSDKSAERIKSVTYLCDIDDDWIDEIEKGLAEVGAAIAEERQFIRSDGEVVPIEKSRHFSKDAVVHLAKHSNLLTHEPEENGDIIPDKIYTVEKLSDYTVYENKFLYMLLMFLKDFVGYRYDKIIEFSYTYNCVYQSEKQIVYNGRSIRYKVDFEEKRKSDPFLKERNKLSEKIERIKSVLTEIEFYLSTPLMVEVAKANIIKPPITRTNVLLMDKHFKEVVKLYDFIYAYKGEGYTVREKVAESSPLREEIASELAETGVLTSFFTYKYNFNLNPLLEEACRREEERLRREEEQRDAARIRSLRRRIEESGVGAEEYMLALEKRNRDFENRISRFEEEKKNFAKTEEALKQSEKENRDKEKQIADLEKNIAAENARRAAETNRLREEAEQRLKLAEAEFEKKFDEKEKELFDKIEAVNAAAAQREEELNAEILSSRDENVAMRERLDNALAEQEKAAAECALTKAKFVALRVSSGLAADEDYTSEESFKEFERQFQAFNTFYDGQWRQAQKKIRKEVLNLDNVKKMAKRRSKKNKDDK